MKKGGVDPSSPAGPEFADEREELLGNEDNIPVEDEEEGEELFGDNFERSVKALKIGTGHQCHNHSTQ